MEVETTRASYGAWRWAGVALGVAVAGASVVAIGLGRWSADLSYDEAYNLHRYARHPLTAAALYLEPNNHPLDSLYRSFFYVAYRLFGWEGDAILWRLPAVVLFGLLLVVLAGWARRLWRASGPFPAVALVCGLLLSTGFIEQALGLRGYFPTQVLVVLFVARLAVRSADFTATRLSRGARREYALILAALCFTLPSNVLLVPILFFAVALAHGVSIRQWRLALLTGGVSSALYLPILGGFVLGINRLDNLPHRTGAGPVQAVVEAGAQLARGVAPAGSGTLGGGLIGLAGLGLIGLLLHRSGGERRVRLAALLGIAPLLAFLLLSAVVQTPARLKSPVIPLFWSAVALGAVELSRHWRPRTQLWAGLGLAALAALFVPSVERRPDHTVSELVARVVPSAAPAGLTLAGSNSPVVSVYLRQLERTRVIGGPGEIEEVLSGAVITRVAEDAAWKTSLRRSFFPELDAGPLSVAAVERVVLIIDRTLPGGEPRAWQHPALAPYLAALPSRGSVERGRFVIRVYGGPMLPEL